MIVYHYGGYCMDTFNRLRSQKTVIYKVSDSMHGYVQAHTNSCSHMYWTTQAQDEVSKYYYNNYTHNY